MLCWSFYALVFEVKHWYEYATCLEDENMINQWEFSNVFRRGSSRFMTVEFSIEKVQLRKMLDKLNATFWKDGWAIMLVLLFLSLIIACFFSDCNQHVNGGHPCIEILNGGSC